MDVFTRRIIGFGVAAANLDGPGVCRMFNRAITRQSMPKHLSSDHDPLFRFQRWRANLRILEVDEIKTIPNTPRSHAFVERLIGTIRREYLDQTLFWNQGDLERKLDSYKVYYNRHRCHTGLAGITPAQRSGAPAHPIASLDSYRWRPHWNGLFETPAAALNGISPHTGLASAWTDDVDDDATVAQRVKARLERFGRDTDARCDRVKSGGPERQARREVCFLWGQQDLQDVFPSGPRARVARLRESRFGRLQPAHESAVFILDVPKVSH